ncbi:MULTISPECIES: GNAT family N-acetyltransferase [Psychrilyobacter]|uniref:GNAT family N-acetyltransferase n=1 Tax=Psychrilyobacter piezotolerans TaxID=2293438 RepID=A0ABX9KG54_9FUSO|nr:MULTISPECIES: GNAT family N-acetyltransferase [Psychrilyobacter]MCS5421571.1 N-acetyltransferase [Psychrilyobacter sp. S5]NDI78583.1 N-acetyltransferase [Psychrilyobacter piezotolerans]RDE60286.1 N-acetyltransferase [Psychrilyobacter sp. S5]REI40394.1 GNAT family N-acetyltransferase [Psychrilyobacter piezotolerans]
MEEIKIIHSLDKGKFLAMDGEVKVGSLGYELKDRVIYINSTYVDPEYRNRFLGKRLLDQCISYAREEKFKISPVCSYVVKIFKKTDKYDDVKVI